MFYRARTIAPLTAGLLALTGGLAAAGAAPATSSAPARAAGAAVDLVSWKLQLPVDTNGGDAPGCQVAEIKQPALDTYRSEWFRRAADGAVTLRAKVEGCRTPGATGARSELREMNGRRNAAWSAQTGSHVLTLRQAVTRLPRSGGRLVVTEILDRSGVAFLVKADASKGSRPGVIGLCYQVRSAKGCLDRAYVLGTPYELTVAVSGGRVRVDYNGARAVDAPLVSTVNYFKAGATLQTNLALGATPGDYGEVVISRLGLTHRLNQPSTTPTTPATPTTSTTPRRRRRRRRRRPRRAPPRRRAPLRRPARRRPCPRPRRTT